MSTAPPDSRGFEYVLAREDGTFEVVGTWQRGSREPDAWRIFITDEPDVADGWAAQLESGERP